jgi:hypothetical protein
MEALTSFG